MKRAVWGLLLAVIVLGGIWVQSVPASTINFSGNAIDFGGAGSFTFIGSGFKVDSVFGGGFASLVGMAGSVGGTFTVGAISSPSPGLQTAAVTGPGTFTLNDGAGGVFSASVAWVDITTFGTLDGLNANSSVNLTPTSYTGVNADLLTLLASPSIVAASFSFVPGIDLVTLANGGMDHFASYAGGLTPVPEPTTLLLFGTGLVGLGVMARRKLLRRTRSSLP